MEIRPYFQSCIGICITFDYICIHIPNTTDMKHFLCLAFITGAILASASAHNGPWHGKLNVAGTQLTLVLRIGTDSLGNSTCTLDSPDQGAYGIPAQLLLLGEDTISVAIPSLGAAFQGIISGGNEGQQDSAAGKAVMAGIFSQMGMRFPLVLKPGEPVLNRPQEPGPPYPYRTEEVSFASTADGAVLAGTLTYPADYDSTRPEATPAVLMVTGSGTQNRDEEIMGHKPFLVIADYLARHGIASLRYDDRGAGSSERGTADITTEVNMQDALAGMQYLRSLGKFGPTGALGHSEGGTIVFMLGARGAADFIISMAGPGMRGDSILVEQNRTMLTRSGISGETADSYCRVLSALFELKIGDRTFANSAALVDSLATSLEAQNLPSEAKSNLAEVWTSLDDPWILNFIRYSPAEDISATSCPVFALNGSLDTQVLPVNLDHIRRLLPGGGAAPDLIREYPGLNHLFQHCRTGSVQEYRAIEETISPEVLSDIASWILSVTQR